MYRTSQTRVIVNCIILKMAGKDGADDMDVEGEEASARWDQGLSEEQA